MFLRETRSDPPRVGITQRELAGTIAHQECSEITAEANSGTAAKVGIGSIVPTLADQLLHSQARSMCTGTVRAIGHVVRSRMKQELIDREIGEQIVAPPSCCFS